ncbi:MAG TPA: S26 family signal peptidase [Candidatus Saccharimonadales bacterium]
MIPAYLPGAIVLAHRRQAKSGEVVVARQAGREVLKRVESVKGNTVYLVGDNRLESTDSREHGPVKKADVMGVVIAQLPGAERRAVPLRSRIFQMSVLYAALLSTMAVAQLVSFEDFITLLQRYTFNGKETAQLVASLVVTAEVLAIPALLNMALSRLFRRLSLGLAGVVALFWLIIAAVFAGSHPIGLFGEFLVVDGRIEILFAALLASLAFFALFGGRFTRKR